MQASVLCSSTATPTPVVKKAAALLGNPVGECRRPFSYLSEEGTEALRKVLEENKAKGMA